MKRIWSPSILRVLRGKRSQSEMGKLIGVPKNTVWRWEAGYATPDPRHTRRLAQLARRERFLSAWKVAGSLELRDDLEGHPREIALEIERSLTRTARRL